MKSRHFGARRETMALMTGVLLCVTASSSCAQATRSPDPAVADSILALAHEWVDTWNQRDVERMAELHADPANTRYGICNDFFGIEGLLDDIRRSDFFGPSWSIQIIDPRVRVLGADGAFVSFGLIGDETVGGDSRPFDAAFTLVLERIDGVWKIVHVQDSTCPEGAE